MTVHDGALPFKLEIQECRTDDEIRAAYPIVRQLRDSLDLSAFLYRVTMAKQGGYRLFCSRSRDGIVGAIGLRIQDDVCWGHNLYVDDLVVDANLRSKGIGEFLMRFAEKLARSEECQCVRLASGISRTEAQRFYERLGYRKTSFAFALDL